MPKKQLGSQGGDKEERVEKIGKRKNIEKSGTKRREDEGTMGN